MATEWKYQQKKGQNQIVLYNPKNPTEKITVSTTDSLAKKYAPQHYTGWKDSELEWTPTGKKTSATIEMKNPLTGTVKTFKRNESIVQKYAPKDYLFDDLQKATAKDKQKADDAAAKAKAEAEAAQKNTQNANATLKGTTSAGFSNPQLMTTGTYKGKVKMKNNGSGADVYFSTNSSIVKNYAPQFYSEVGAAEKKQQELAATGVPAQDVQALVDLYKNKGISEATWKEFTTTGQIPQAAVSALQNAGYQLTDQPSYNQSPASNTTTDGEEGMGTGFDDINAYLDDALAKGLITQEQYDLFKLTAAGWDDGQEVNMENVLQKWGEIKESAIDPYFKAEIDFQTNQLTEAIAAQNATYEQQLEAEKTNAGLAVRQAKEELEKAGMTFTGKGIENLGAKSAYAVPSPEGTSAIPNQTPFGDLFYEGLVNQQNRLISSSSSLKNKQSLQNLGQQAESQLGSVAAAKFGIPGYKVTGGVVGAIPSAQQQAYGNLLTNLSGQQNQVSGYKNPLQFNF